jgi:hypothetical protein
MILFINERITLTTDQDNDEKHYKLVSFGTPEEIAAKRQAGIDQFFHDINEGPYSSAIQTCAKTIAGFDNPKPEQPDIGLRDICANLLNNIHGFRDDKVQEFIPMLATQATLLNALFNRSLQLAGLENKENFCTARADIALQAQRQCRILLEFMHRHPLS